MSPIANGRLLPFTIVLALITPGAGVNVGVVVDAVLLCVPALDVDDPMNVSQCAPM